MSTRAVELPAMVFDPGDALVDALHDHNPW
jgi:hypothetical protein